MSKSGVMTNNRIATLAIILVSYAMIVLDIQIVITALPKIRYGLAFRKPDSRGCRALMLVFGGLLLLGARRATSWAGAACSSRDWRSLRSHRLLLASRAIQGTCYHFRDSINRRDQ